jgi:hypothetical protein
LSVTDISTSYPNGEQNTNRFVSVWYNEYYAQHEPGYPILIWITGPEHNDYITREGSIVIELEFIEKTIPESVNFVVGAGSQGNVLYPCNKTIEVPLSY